MTKWLICSPSQSSSIVSQQPNHSIWIKEYNIFPFRRIELLLFDPGKYLMAIFRKQYRYACVKLGRRQRIWGIFESIDPTVYKRNECIEQNIFTEYIIRRKARVGWQKSPLTLSRKRVRKCYLFRWNMSGSPSQLTPVCWQVN